KIDESPDLFGVVGQALSPAVRPVTRAFDPVPVAPARNDTHESSGLRGSVAQALPPAIPLTTSAATFEGAICRPNRLPPLNRRCSRRFSIVMQRTKSEPTGISFF